MHGVHTMHCRLLEDILNLQTFLVTSVLTFILMVYCMSLFSMTGAPRSSLLDLTVLAVKTIDIEI